MGCDGGTIPKRNEIVKNKPQDASRDKNADLSARWQFCALSGLPLKRPIVACKLGQLYNKEAIIEHLLRQRSLGKSSQAPIAAHIKSLKDVKELQLREKVEIEKSNQTSSRVDYLNSQFVCPISGLELNGKYRFYYILTCGCVLSERALKEVPNDSECLNCHGTYNSDEDLITINGDADDLKVLRSKLLTRRKSRTSNKRTHDGSLKKE